MTENSFPVCLVMRDGTSSSTVRCLPAARTSTELTSWVRPKGSHVPTLSNSPLSVPESSSSPYSAASALPASSFQCVGSSNQ